MTKKSSLVQIPAQIVDFRPKKDRSYKITFETRELSGKEVAILVDNFQGEGWLLYDPNEAIKEVDIPKGSADSGLEGKTPSQRLRSAIFVLWQQSGEPGADFNRYYQTQVERMIDAIKEKLE